MELLLWSWVERCLSLPATVPLSEGLTHVRDPFGTLVNSAVRGPGSLGERIHMPVNPDRKPRADVDRRGRHRAGRSVAASVDEQLRGRPVRVASALDEVIEETVGCHDEEVEIAPLVGFGTTERAHQTPGDDARVPRERCRGPFEPGVPLPA